MKSSLVQAIFVDIGEALLKAAVNACASFEIERRVRYHEKTCRGFYNSLVQILGHDMSCETCFQLRCVPFFFPLPMGARVISRTLFKRRVTVQYLSSKPLREDLDVSTDESS